MYNKICPKCNSEKEPKIQEIVSADDMKTYYTIKCCDCGYIFERQWVGEKAQREIDKRIYNVFNPPTHEEKELASLIKTDTDVSFIKRIIRGVIKKLENYS